MKAAIISHVIPANLLFMVFPSFHRMSCGFIDESFLQKNMSCVEEIILPRELFFNR